MLFRSIIATTIGVLAGFAAAQDITPELIRAIQDIGNTTVRLNRTLVSWNGNVAGYNTLSARANDTIDLIDGYAQNLVPRQTVNFTDDEVLDIATALGPLLDAVNGTLVQFINAERKFASLCRLKLARIVLGNIRTASNRLVNPLIKRIPPLYQDAAQALVVKPLAEYFGTAQTNYTGAINQLQADPNWKGWDGKWSRGKFGSNECYGWQGYGGHKPTTTSRGPKYPKPTRY